MVEPIKMYALNLSAIVCASQSASQVEWSWKSWMWNCGFEIVGRLVKLLQYLKLLLVKLKGEFQTIK